MIPPLTMWLDVQPAGRRRVRLWLPLFLLWIVLLPLLVLAFIVTILADVVLWLVGEPYHRYTLLLWRCLEVLGESRGTTVRVNSDHTIVDIAIS